METLTFQCGNCNKLLAVGSAYLGQQVRCPHCRQVVIAPTQPAPTSPLPEAAKEEDPLATSPPANSPFAVAGDAPSPVHPATTATDPPSEPVAPPPAPDDPFSHLNDPRLELMPAILPPPADGKGPPAPPTFSAFEAAVDDVTPPAPAGAAVLDVPAVQIEVPPLPPPTDCLSPTADLIAPWSTGTATGAGAAAPPMAPRPRRSQTGLMLFVFLVFLPLVLYAILVTILAVRFYLQRGSGAGQPDPRLLLPDEKGDHPGVERLQESYYTDPLPKSQRVALGQTLTVGDLEIQPLRVEYRTVRVSVGGREPEEALYPSLVLYLKLSNNSSEVAFYPLDAYFNRQWDKGTGARPLTLVEAGPARYYGGSARWGGGEHEAVEGDNLDKRLRPGDGGEYFVCTNGYADDARKLAKFTGPLLWRVQVRRGLVRYQDKDLSATAVIGVEFSDKDVVHRPGPAG